VIEMLKINDRVKILEGTFKGREGIVKKIDGSSITVEINIFKNSRYEVVIDKKFLEKLDR